MGFCASSGDRNSGADPIPGQDVLDRVDIVDCNILVSHQVGGRCRKQRCAAVGHANPEAGQDLLSPATNG